MLLLTYRPPFNQWRTNPAATESTDKKLQREDMEEKNNAKEITDQWLLESLYKHGETRKREREQIYRGSV